MTTMVGHDIRRERAVDGDGSDEEGEDGKGDGGGNEGAVTLLGVPWYI